MTSLFYQKSYFVQKAFCKAHMTVKIHSVITRLCVNPKQTTLSVYRCLTNDLFVDQYIQTSSSDASLSKHDSDTSFQQVLQFIDHGSSTSLSIQVLKTLKYLFLNAYTAIHSFQLKDFTSIVIKLKSIYFPSKLL